MLSNFRAALERQLDDMVVMVTSRALADEVIRIAQQRGLPLTGGTIERQVTSLGRLSIEQLDGLGNQLFRRATVTAGGAGGLLGLYGIFGLPLVIYFELIKTIEVTGSLMYAYGFFPDDDLAEFWLGLAAALEAGDSAASVRQVMLRKAARRVAVAAANQARRMIVARLIERSLMTAPARSIPVLGLLTGGVMSTRAIYRQGKRAKAYYREARLSAS